MNPFLLMKIQLQVVIFLKAHWKKLVIPLALAMSFVVGRYMAPTLPAKVEVREKIVEKVVERTVVDQKMVETEVQKRVKEYEMSLDRKTTETTTKSPDGTTTTTKTTDTHINKRENQVEVKYVDRIVEKTVYVDRVVEKEIKTEIKVDNSRSWRAGPMVGIRPQLLPIPTFGPMVLGVEVERRIVGPVWVGAWGLTTGSVGLKIAVDF